MTQKQLEPKTGLRTRAPTEPHQPNPTHTFRTTGRYTVLRHPGLGASASASHLGTDGLLQTHFLHNNLRLELEMQREIPHTFRMGFLK